MIGRVLTMEEWAQLTNNIRATGSVQGAVEMVPWILAELPPERAAKAIATYPPIVSQMYQKAWLPKYQSVSC